MLSPRGLLVDVYPIVFDNYRATYPGIAPTLTKILGWRFVELIDIIVREYLTCTYHGDWPASTHEFTTEAREEAVLFIESHCNELVADGKFDYDDIQKNQIYFEEEVSRIVDEVRDALRTQLPSRELCVVYDPRWVAGELVLTVEFCE